MSTLRSDESVKIPAAVLAASNMAEAFYQTETPEGEQTTQVESEAAPETPRAEVPAAEAPAFTSEVSSTDDQSWEHRYKSMKGRFDRSQSQIQQLSEQIQSLQSVISNLETSQTRTNPSENLVQERFITPEEENDYGAEFLSVVGKKAKEELMPIVRQYEAKMANLEQQLKGVGGIVQQDARQKMITTLTERIPDWEVLNKDKNFIDWLQLPDIYSGANRHKLLMEAYERNDTPRVAAFFQGFLAEEAATRPANADIEVPQGAIAPKVDPMTLAAPGRAKSAAAAAPAEKPFFTSAQITRFYADVNSGKFRGREADKAKLEAQIFDAQREGRIG
jgi:hypothetical protein